MDPLLSDKGSQTLEVEIVCDGLIKGGFHTREVNQMLIE